MFKLLSGPLTVILTCVHVYYHYLYMCRPFKHTHTHTHPHTFTRTDTNSVSYKFFTAVICAEGEKAWTLLWVCVVSGRSFSTCETPLTTAQGGGGGRWGGGWRHPCLFKRVSMSLLRFLVYGKNPPFYHLTVKTFNFLLYFPPFYLHRQTHMQEYKEDTHTHTLLHVSKHILSGEWIWANCVLDSLIEKLNSSLFSSPASTPPPLWSLSSSFTFFYSPDEESGAQRGVKGQVSGIPGFHSPLEVPGTRSVMKPRAGPAVERNPGGRGEPDHG